MLAELLVCSWPNIVVDLVALELAGSVNRGVYYIYKYTYVIGHIVYTYSGLHYTIYNYTHSTGVCTRVCSCVQTYNEQIAFNNSFCNLASAAKRRPK